MKKENTFIIEEESLVKAYLPCDCQCSIIEISEWKDLDVAWLSIYVSAFHEKQSTLPYKIKQRVKLAWRILRGKEYKFYELTIPKDQLRNFFKEYLNRVGEQ